MPDSLIGKTLGQYQITALAGRGGMATVYKAYQPSLKRYVALKVLPDHLAVDQEFVARFRQEALAAAALRHSNILVIHDVGQEGNSHYIAMEYLEGQTLSDVLRRTGADLQQAVRILSIRSCLGAGLCPPA
jgi:serine/threonine-protein kinase